MGLFEIKLSVNRTKYLHHLSEILYLSNSKITSELSFYMAKVLHTHTHLHTCTQAHTRTHTYTHTHTHTHTSPFYSYVNNVCVAGVDRCIAALYARNLLQMFTKRSINNNIFICVRLQYWQNQVKSMGRSLQVQILNYLSILSLESSMDAQNNWFMHTINQSICFAKILCGSVVVF